MTRPRTGSTRWPRLAVYTVLLALAGVLLRVHPLGAREVKPSHENALALEEQLVDAVARVAPATVAVHAFRIYRDPNRGEVQVEGGVGSGVLIDEAGRILTCAHVLAHPHYVRLSVKVTLASGQTHPARVLGTSPTGDFAMLQMEDLEPGQALPPPVVLGSSAALRPGDWVLALGHPGGPNMDGVPAACLGRITRIGVELPRRLGTRVSRGMLQTDAPLFSGNSGGPLVDSSGRLVGLNSAISVLDDRAFAIPIDEILEAREQLERGETVVPRLFAREPEMPSPGPGDQAPEERGDRPPMVPRGSIGAYLGDLEPDAGGGARGGCLVRGVEPGLTASQAGLRRGDVITAIDGTAVSNADEAARMIGAREPGQRVLFTVLRNGSRFTMTVEIGSPLY